MREPVYYSGSAEFFDTHAHIYDRKYADCNTSVEDILQRCRASGVTSMLIPADSEETSRLAIDLAVKYDGFDGMKLYSSCGVHPHEAKTYTEDTEKYLRECLEHREEKKIRALGEIGLDYYYDLSERSVQRFFIRGGSCADSTEVRFPRKKRAVCPYRGHAAVF